MAGQDRFKFNPMSAAVMAALATPACVTAQSTAPGEQALPEVKVTAPTDTSFKSDTTSVGSKGAPVLLRDVPQSVTIINRAVIESQGASSLADALRNVPGLTIGAAEAGQIGNNFNLRGFSARTDIYLDGARDRGQYYRDLFSLESIEVLKGPSSMLFGRGSTGGVINQVSKVPSLTPRNEVSITAGTQPSVRTVGDFNKPLSETSAFRVSVMAQDVNSTRDVMQNQDYGIAPSLRFGIGTPTEITLSALVMHNKDMADYGLPPVNGHPATVNRNNFYGVTDDHLTQDVGSFDARIDHKFSSTVSLRNQLSYNNVNVNALESGPNNIGTVTAGIYTPLPNGNTVGNFTNLPLSRLSVQLGSHDRKIVDKSLYNQTDLTTEFSTGFLKHTLISGLELGRETYDRQDFVRGGMPVVSLTAPIYQATPVNSVTINGNYAQSSAYTVAPYVNDTIEFSKQWKAVAGLRWDSYRASTTNTVVTATAPASASQTVNYTSKRAGLIYQPSNTQSYYASYGTSFNPSLETLTATTGSQSLDPETSRSQEVGSKWDLFNNNLSLTTALFQIQKYNARVQVSPGIFQSVGQIQVKGFELGLTGRITPQWQVMAGYAYLDATIVQGLPAEQGQVPANTPRNSASLWTTYNLTKEWEIGGGGTYMSDRYANNTNTVEATDYVRWDTTAAYHQPKYDIRLNVLNIANRQNYDALIPSDGGRSVPGLSRTALVTYTYKF